MTMRWIQLGMCALAAAIGCASEVSGDSRTAESGEGAGLAEASGPDPAALSGGHKQPLVEGVNAAENLLFSSDGRLFVSGDDGIFEVIHDGGSYHAVARHSGESCHFGGMVEYQRTIYANCYDMTDSSLFAATLGSAPEFRVIYKLPGTSLANGLTSDGAGNLFVAATLQGEIIRLTLRANDAFMIESEQNLVPDAGLFANGIKYFNSRLYWTNFTQLETSSISSTGGVGSNLTLNTSLTFFDDLYVDRSGILVADAINGAVVAFSLRGLPDGSTPNGVFEGPSAVLPASGRLGLANGALVVSERNGNRVSAFTP